MDYENLFTTYERLEICRRVEVTLDNLHELARFFNGSAVYSGNPAGKYPSELKPHVFIPERAGGTPGIVEVGSWADERGSRWNPAPLTQGWSPAGTYQRIDPEPEPATPKPPTDEAHPDSYSTDPWPEPDPTDEEAS